MSEYQVTPAEVSFAAASCDATATEVATQLATLRTYVVNLEASWQGVAAVTFQNLMQEYDVYSKMLHEALTDIGSGLRGNYVNYSESEQANLNSIKAIQAGLPSANLT
ncbi:WXG100 family type VII secretion target [Streptomyces tsukubensis]|uniref:WXG100 family type VII secretion target n=1 Tax=Streptomyces tsukubensis TaxID=83656 RepID=UPI001D04FD15|nr:WXG100 family type VII secretion target [Streptomyces tsukubensis]